MSAFKCNLKSFGKYNTYDKIKHGLLAKQGGWSLFSVRGEGDQAFSNPTDEGRWQSYGWNHKACNRAIDWGS